ncbi:hypothetical protein EDEG_01623 [Edhazardia aedis USNM 41457]|uniref:Uncharacterized protein n=1 Tax=Edhazardia aedis (strain USNM 41457) TaxID=1003232 RepID=J9D8N0_EDHAE|nr:hypothetical protein EDEG_01623 [Edhazardia aedis USNM 41457]|eukprot:EJW04101.1 hypothetical protein EDEG_01623 [Edhazardia aedis USNM 41457]
MNVLYVFFIILKIATDFSKIPCDDEEKLKNFSMEFRQRIEEKKTMIFNAINATQCNVINNNDPNFMKICALNNEFNEIYQNNQFPEMLLPGNQPLIDVLTGIASDFNIKMTINTNLLLNDIKVSIDKFNNSIMSAIVRLIGELNIEILEIFNLIIPVIIDDLNDSILQIVDETVIKSTNNIQEMDAKMNIDLQERMNIAYYVINNILLGYNTSLLESIENAFRDGDVNLYNQIVTILADTTNRDAIMPQLIYLDSSYIQNTVEN